MTDREHDDRSSESKRSTSQHWAAVAEIGVWLSGLMGRDGTVISVDNSPETDTARVEVRFVGHRRYLDFSGLSLLADVQPRDELSAAITAELRDPTMDDAFPLGGYAESAAMKRRSHEH